MSSKTKGGISRLTNIPKSIPLAIQSNPDEPQAPLFLIIMLNVASHQYPNMEPAQPDLL